ncbi:MAG: SDR family oxidoreductase [Lachnospiraceae bacterium]|nr:SDR family oxidoreductase [Lachnospiraceae bacterium]
MKKDTVLITGASSGLGREMARIVSKDAHKLILVGRNTERLKELKSELVKAGGDLEVVTEAMDLGVHENCEKLHENYSDVDLLINNAGFGDFGDFDKTSLDKDVQMIETNVIALHMLTKLYLKDMIEKDSGHILNVASIAGFMPGPLMATYYATKAYVVRISEAIRQELKRKGSKVGISILCPGPVSTNFAKNANISFLFMGSDVHWVAEYALKHLNRFYIVPKLYVKVSRIAIRFIPTALTARIIYFLQSKRKVEK